MFGNNKNIQLNKLGKVTEEEDKILVYVKRGIVYKYCNKVMLCEGIKEKSIYYIFDNISFGDKTCINGKDAYLIFRNCSFTQSFKVERANQVEMENNKFAFYGYVNNFVDLTANKIIIKNNSFANTSFAKNFDEPRVDFTLIGNTINLENSILCSEYVGNINIMTNYLSLKGSIINSPAVYIAADNITTTNSVIKACNKIEVINKNCNFTCAIKSPITIYNDIKLNSSNSQIIEIDEEKAKLLEYRVQLINTLHQVEMDCLEENSFVLTEIQKKLRNRKISKVLKK